MVAITVVIALFNKSKYIEKCIQSVLQQSYQNWRLVIVDDGSTDDSLEKARKYTHEERIIIVTQDNAGPGSARNAGLKLCDTKYIAFLDADDFWKPQFIEKALLALENNSVSDLWLCGSIWEPLGEKRPPFLKQEGDHSGGNWSVGSFLSGEEVEETVNLFATGAVVAKTEVIRKYHGYFDKKKVTFGEDAYLWLQVLFNHSCYREKEFLLVVNTEGSDLGIGRRSVKPIPPSLLYPEPLIHNCPVNHQPSLWAYLNLIAFMAFRREVYQGKIGSAFKLWITYPKLVHYKSQEFLPIPLALMWYPFRLFVKNMIKHK